MIYHSINASVAFHYFSCKKREDVLMESLIIKRSTGEVNEPKIISDTRLVADLKI